MAGVKRRSVSVQIKLQMVRSVFSNRLTWTF